ncbi:hypothetical protein K470DRAFT_217565, partial [Piedraia hortae CBS 480.64]
MRHALETVRNLESQPSCQKVAAAALVHSCSTLEGSISPDPDDESKGIDTFLNEEMTVYATRLAVCELNVVRKSVPTECEVFIPTTRQPKTKILSALFSLPANAQQAPLGYKETSKERVGQCISALRMESQTWTSYSNSYHNAVNICNAMRGEVEKDHELSRFKVLTKATESVADALNQSKENWDALKASYNELIHAARESRNELTKSSEKVHEATLNFWGRWEKKVQDGLQSIFTQVNNINSFAEEARREQETSQVALADTLNQLKNQASDLVKQHTKGMEQAAADVATLQ